MNLLRRAGGDETMAQQGETIFPNGRRWPETGGVYGPVVIYEGFDHVGSHRHPLPRILLGTFARDAEI